MNHTRYWKTAIAVSMLPVAAMCLAAEFSGRHEFFFPELPALAMGCFWMEKRPWHSSRWLIFSGMTCGALLGFLLLKIPGCPTAARMILGYAGCGLWLCRWKTNLTPMLSACLLPILLGGASVFYPVAIAAETALLCLLDLGMERYGLRCPQPFIPLEDTFKLRAVRWLKLTLLLTVLVLAARGCGTYFVVPPLVVAFSAFADSQRPVRRHLLLGIGFCAAAAVTGVLARRLGLYLELPVVIPATLLVALLGAFCKKFAYFLPPVAAVMLLPFLVPPDQLTAYMWQVPVGSVFFIGAGRLFSFVEEKFSH